MKKLVLALLILLLAIAAVGATIYKWVDEKGTTHYSETPPAGQKAKKLDARPTTPGTGATTGVKPEGKSWQQLEEEFRQRHQAREEAQARERARKKLESAERQSYCRTAKDELARLQATAPRLKRRGFVPFVDPEAEEQDETMNNAERTLKIQQAEEEIKKWCD